MLQRSSQVGEFYRMTPPAVWDKSKKLPGTYMVSVVSTPQNTHTRHPYSALTCNSICLPLFRTS